MTRGISGRTRTRAEDEATPPPESDHLPQGRNRGSHTGVTYGTRYMLPVIYDITGYNNTSVYFILSMST